MNLFVIALNLSKEGQLRVVPKLRQMSEVYPNLGTDTLWEWRSTDGTILAASIHTADKLAAPRCYVDQRDDQVVFYSGLPINPAGNFLAHQAEALAANWDQLIDSLEGIYSIARIMNAPLQVEIQTDILGFEQVYWFHQDDLWLISNSVQLIDQIKGSGTLDPFGLSLFLTTDWVGSDHTLQAGIKTIPAAQRWTWREGNPDPTQQTYYPASNLVRNNPYQMLANSGLNQLADDLAQPLSNLADNFDALTCALTGGRDSRLITALLSSNNIPAQYYTCGDRSGGDAKVATLVTRTLGLPYEILDVEVANLIMAWNTVTQQMVRQSGGMQPLYHIEGPFAFLNRPLESLSINLWGAGGEIGRGYYYTPNLFFSKPGIDDIKNHLVTRAVKNYRGLIRPESVSLAQDYIYQFVEQYLDDGFAPIDVLDAFYAYQRVGRRAGNNMHATCAFYDSFSPFCTRPFLEATFATPAVQRYTEPLHYNLIRFLTPKLHGLPFESKPWRSQQPVVNLLKVYWNTRLRKKFDRYLNRLKRTSKLDSPSSGHILTNTMFDRTTLFEAKREQIREICLMQKDSLIWDLVDRSMFELITSSDTSAVERSHYLKCIFIIASAFYYEANDQLLANSAPVAS